MIIDNDIHEPDDNNEQSDGNEQSSINDVTFSPENDDDENVTVGLEADKDKSDSSLINQSTMNETVMSGVNELPKHTIPPNKEAKKVIIETGCDKVIKKKRLRLSSNTKISHIIPEEVSKKIAVVLSQPNGYSPDELAEKIASVTNQLDYVADIKSYLRAIANNNNDLADRHGILGYGSVRDFGYRIDDEEKFKDIIRKAKDPKHIWGVVDRPDTTQTTLTVLPVGVNVNERSVGEEPSESTDQHQAGNETSHTENIAGNQEIETSNAENTDQNQGVNQENDTSGQADVTSQVDAQVDAVELSEDDVMTELVLKVADILKSSDKSVLVTGLRHFTYFTGNPHTPAISQSQQLVRAPQAVIKFANAIFGCVSVGHYGISELLSPIIGAINNAESVLVVANIIDNLRTFIVQVLRMSPSITEVERALLSSNGGCNGGSILEILEAQLTNHIRAVVNSNLNRNIAEETCISEQDTDVDDFMPEYFHSNAAYCVDNTAAEVLELRGCQCQMCALLLHQRKYIVKQVLSNPRCCSLLNDELLHRLATLVVNVNSHSDCYFKILRIDLPFEALQRNLIHGCQNLRAVVESMDPVYLRRVLDSMVNGLFINWNHLKSLADQQMPIGEQLLNPEHVQRLKYVANLQQCIDRLCGQFINSLFDDLHKSILQPFAIAATVSKHVPSYMESVHRSFSWFQHYFYKLVHSYANLLPNTLTPKISISVTVISGGVSVSMEELNDYLRSCLASKGWNCHITRLLRLPPASIINNEPMMIVANLSFTFPSTFFLQVGLITNPVEAVDSYNRDSLVMITAPTYGFHDDENSHNSIEESEVSVSDSIPNPNDHDKKIGYLDIYEHSLAENGPHQHNDFDHGDNEVTQISVEATISRGSTNKDQQV